MERSFSVMPFDEEFDNTAFRSDTLPFENSVSTIAEIFEDFEPRNSERILQLQQFTDIGLKAIYLVCKQENLDFEHTEWYLAKSFVSQWDLSNRELLTDLVLLILRTRSR